MRRLRRIRAFECFSKDAPGFGAPEDHDRSYRRDPTWATNTRSNAAAKNAQKMVRILDAAKPSQTDPFGLAEDQVVTLFQLWLIVGSWAQTSEYVNLHKDGMLYPRAPKPNPGGNKDLDLVRPAIKGVANTYGKDTDTNRLKGAFDLAHGRMIKLHAGVPGRPGQEEHGQGGGAQEEAELRPRMTSARITRSTGSESPAGRPKTRHRKKGTLPFSMSRSPMRGRILLL